ncbi:HAD family hydrolase [Lacticaseibacillus hulanensis]|uniref:HAD family hydrolase n=1 Tax=Lacticaseibacillus hulanensis TaxID=2493111 RepID=UPI000FDC2020|nr:HAD family phosphatase [Lacticaseibacillus hulanensis]
MIDAVVFDMDGVLVNSEPVYFNRQIRFIKEFGVTPMTTNIQDYVGRPSEVVWARAIPDEAAREQVRTAYAKYDEHTPIDFSTIVNPGIPELLQYLKTHDFKTAIASAGPLDNINLMLGQTGLKPYFDVVVSGETITQNKPDPQVYLESLAGLAARPEQSVAIEDSFTGITAAHRAGMQAWAMRPTAYELDQSSADYIADGAEQILGKLQLLS